MVESSVDPDPARLLARAQEEMPEKEGVPRFLLKVGVVCEGQ
jgi:hypothetical protein